MYNPPVHSVCTISPYKNQSPITAPIQSQSMYKTIRTNFVPTLPFAAPSRPRTHVRAKRITTATLKEAEKQWSDA